MKGKEAREITAVSIRGMEIRENRRRQVAAPVATFGGIVITRIVHSRR